jgi:uncharacterized protein YuzE
MKLQYYPETDSLYIELKSAPGTEARERVAGLVVDLDANGDVVGFDIDHASRKLDLSKVETIALPPASAAEWDCWRILSPRARSAPSPIGRGVG